MAELNTPNIPYDMYESPQEVIIIINQYSHSDILKIHKTK